MRIVAVVLMFIHFGPVSIGAQAEVGFQGKSASQWADALAGDATREVASRTLRRNVPAVAPILPVLLNDARPRVRQTAMFLAGQSGAAAASSVPQLRCLLASPQPYTRMSAASALGHIGAAAAPAAPEMVRLLGEKDERRRIEVARSLWRIGRAGGDALVRVLRAGPTDRIVDALGRGGERAVPVLVPLLDDADVSVRRAAADALVLAGWTAIPALERIGRTGLVRRILDECYKRHFQEDLRGRRFVARPEPPLDLDRMSADWETGRGHGRNLSMFRFQWIAGAVRVDRIHYRCPFRGIARATPISVASATMDAARGRAMFRALAAAIRIRLEDTPVSLAKGRGFWGSSATFHSRLRVRVAGRPVHGGEYAGRPGFMHQPEYYRLRIADGILNDAVNGIDWAECPPSDEVLERLLARAASASDSKWWVEERILLIIRSIGDARFLPFLEQIISRPLGRAKRTELYAIDTYARLSGVDFRPPLFTEKEVPAAQERYLRHFADRRAHPDSDG